MIRKLLLAVLIAAGVGEAATAQDFWYPRTTYRLRFYSNYWTTPDGWTYGGWRDRWEDDRQNRRLQELFDRLRDFRERDELEDARTLQRLDELNDRLDEIRQLRQLLQAIDSRLAALEAAGE